MGYEDLCSQLESIGEALTERSIETLQSAIRDGADAHPPEEKALARAQRSIDKAIHILRSLDAD
jgi:hypothetical protein